VLYFTCRRQGQHLLHLLPEAGRGRGVQVGLLALRRDGPASVQGGSGVRALKLRPAGCAGPSAGPDSPWRRTWLGSLKPSRTLVPAGMLPSCAMPAFGGPMPPELSLPHCALKRVHL
jgi:hypothetical protein